MHMQTHSSTKPAFAGTGNQQKKSQAKPGGRRDTRGHSQTKHTPKRRRSKKKASQEDEKRTAKPGRGREGRGGSQASQRTDVKRREKYASGCKPEHIGDRHCCQRKSHVPKAENEPSQRSVSRCETLPEKVKH